MKPSILDAVEPQTTILNYPTRTETQPAEAKSAQMPHSGPPPRPAWIEIDLRQLRNNFRLIKDQKSAALHLLSVVKDNGYGHGALAIARAALDAGARFLALSTLEEAMSLRDQGVKAPLLLLGDRQENELPWCIAHDLTCCVSEPRSVKKLGELAVRAGKRVPVHLKINTGMNRYGICWTEAAELATLIGSTPSLCFEGVLTHFAQSDETEKTFARLQLARFEEALRLIDQLQLRVE